MFIVKVQQSLSSSDGVKSILIYNQDGSIWHESFEPEEVKPVLELLGDEPKAYYTAKLTPEGKIELLARTENKSW